MAGQERATSSDGSHTVTVGSADDQHTPGATAYVSQQNDQGQKLTTVYDANHNVVREVERPKP